MLVLQNLSVFQNGHRFCWARSNVVKMVLCKLISKNLSFIFMGILIPCSHAIVMTQGINDILYYISIRIYTGIPIKVNTKNVSFILDGSFILTFSESYFFFTIIVLKRIKCVAQHRLSSNIISNIRIEQTCTILLCSARQLHFAFIHAQKCIQS